MPTATTYLEALNPEQRRAVEHGAAGGQATAPLLVIAGAGSGKTNTLAHRVAHLIVHGADPRRILLMTFSRRAASEMTKRVERIARKVLGEVYRPLYLNQAPIMYTERRTAELIKYAANAFLATKITFINEMADLSEKVGADVQEVARGIGLDNRIGSKFLNAGPGFGGSGLQCAGR